MRVTCGVEGTFKRSNRNNDPRQTNDVDEQQPVVRATASRTSRWSYFPHTHTRTYTHTNTYAHTHIKKKKEWQASLACCLCSFFFCYWLRFKISFLFLKSILSARLPLSFSFFFCSSSYLSMHGATPGAARHTQRLLAAVMQDWRLNPEWTPEWTPKWKWSPEWSPEWNPTRNPKWKWTPEWNSNSCPFRRISANLPHARLAG